MAEINAKDLTAKTSPATTDSMLLFGTTSNEGAKITVDNMKDWVLSGLSTKTFPNQVGGSSAATILAQLSTLNSNFTEHIIDSIYYSNIAGVDIYHKLVDIIDNTDRLPTNKPFIVKIEYNNYFLIVGWVSSNKSNAMLFGTAPGLAFQQCKVSGVWQFRTWATSSFTEIT